MVEARVMSLISVFCKGESAFVRLYLKVKVMGHFEWISHTAKYRANFTIVIKYEITYGLSIWNCIWAFD